MTTVRVHLALTSPAREERRWSVPIDAVLTLTARLADGPPPPPAAAVAARPPTAEDLTGWLSAWAPVELVLDDPVNVLQVASPALRSALSDHLPALGATGTTLAVCYGSHRFDLSDRLDRSLWRLLSAGGRSRS